MIKGTTAQFKFKIPYPINELQWVTIKFWQPGNDDTVGLPIIKQKMHCDAEDNSKELCVSLTAIETLRFSTKLKARVQLRAQHISGLVFGNKEKLVPVYPLDDDLTQDPVLPGETEDGWVILDGKEIIS